jgi:hypothetical protein
VPVRTIVAQHRPVGRAEAFLARHAVQLGGFVAVEVEALPQRLDVPAIAESANQQRADEGDDGGDGGGYDVHMKYPR